ncbi:MAG: DUF998 domain-containing protein [Thermoplasmatota archaeon]
MWDAGLASLACGLVLMGRGLRRLLPFHRDARWACRLLTAAGGAVALMVLFPTDEGALPSSATGWIHDVAAIAAVAAQGAAMLLMVDAGRGARGSPAWAAVAGRSWGWPACAVTLAFLWGFGDLTKWWPLSSVVQRLLAATMAGWLIAVAVRARSVAPRGTVARDGDAATQGRP